MGGEGRKTHPLSSIPVPLYPPCCRKSKERKKTNRRLRVTGKSLRRSRRRRGGEQARQDRGTEASREGKETVWRAGERGEGGGGRAARSCYDCCFYLARRAGLNSTSRLGFGEERGRLGRERTRINDMHISIVPFPTPLALPASSMCTSTAPARRAPSSLASYTRVVFFRCPRPRPRPPPIPCPPSISGVDRRVSEGRGGMHALEDKKKKKT